MTLATLRSSRSLADSSRVALAALFGALLSLSCASSAEERGFQSGVPAVNTTMAVRDVIPRGPYLEAHLGLGDREFMSYALDSDTCREVFQAGSDVVYKESGPQGVYARGEVRCQSMGVGNLVMWRDRNRRTATSPVLRAQANFRTIHRDDEVTLLRGQFPLASALGFTGNMDMVAVVENTEVCQVPIDSGVASMEYRGRGQRPLALVGARGLCLIQGLIQPPPQGRPAKKDESGDS